MMTCKQASQLLSQRQDRTLSRRERIGLRLHVWICINCRRFERQLNFMRQILQRGSCEGHLPVEKPLPADSAERIRKALHDHHGE